MNAIERRALIAALAPAIREFVEEAVDPLEDRIAELEARPTIRYCGAWESGEEYTPGNMVTFSGSLWHCNADTAQKPGTGADWTLAAKRGRDGRDVPRGARE